MLTLILAVAVAMGVSFLCSVMEAAILSLNPGKLARLEKVRPRIGRICAGFKRNLEKPIAVILILNTTAHTFGAAVAGAQFDKLFGSEYIWLFSLVFTVLMVQYTEILPKTLGVRYNLAVMAATASILKFATVLMTPVIQLVHWINRPFERGTAETPEESETLEELDALAAQARRENHISPVQEQAIRQIPDLRDDKVTEIMVPLEKMVCVQPGMEVGEVLRIARENPHERYPVRDPRENRFLGVLEIRRLLFQPGAEWEKLVRPVTSVEPGCALLHIAENIRALDSRLILVRDSRAGVLGMLTTTDLLNNLFPTPGTVSPTLERIS